MIDYEIMEDVPNDPEYIETAEEIEDISNSIDSEDDTYSSDIDPVTEISWAELGIALGLGQEMIQGELSNLRSDHQLRQSAKEYKDTYIDSNKQSGKKGNNKNPASHVGRDLRPFERFVAGQLSMIAQNEFNKISPTAELKKKLRVLGINYKELLNQLLINEKAIRYKYLTKNIDDLNINICVDLCNIVTECIAMDTSDVQYVIRNSNISVATPQVRRILSDLKMEKSTL
jgi:hypothetical protein